MEDFRSKSCGDGRMQTESYNYSGHKPTLSNLQDFRCYSAAHASSSSSSSYAQPPHTQMEIVKDVKLKKGKSMNGSSKSWSFNDPELQRKKRVASYKAYTVEGKVKGSLRNSFRWLKDKYNHMVYG